jgi:hypothetical protein
VAIEQHKSRLPDPPKRKQASEQHTVVPAQHHREFAVVENLADAVCLLDRQGGRRGHIARSELRIASIGEHRGFQAICDLRANTLTQS